MRSMISADDGHIANETAIRPAVVRASVDRAQLFGLKTHVDCQGNVRSPARVMLGGAIMQAAHFSRVMPEPRGRVLALLSLVVFVGVAVFSYVDTGLTFPRLTMFLGIIMGVLSVIERIDWFQPLRD